MMQTDLDQTAEHLHTELGDELHPERVELGFAFEGWDRLGRRVLLEARVVDVRRQDLAHLD